MANRKRKAKKWRNLRHLREVAFVITRDRKLVVVFNAKAKTSAFFPQLNKMIIAENICPKVVKKYPILRQKLLDGAVIHESGHRLLTHPLEANFRDFEERSKYPNLAHLVINIVEDKRINHFMKARYRFDYGKRLAFRHRVIRDSCDTELKYMAEKGKIPKAQVVRLAGAMADIGLYGAKCDGLVGTFTPQMKKDLGKLLEILEGATYKRVRMDVVNACKAIYKILEPYATSDIENFGALCPSEIAGGELGKVISKALAKLIEKEGERLEKEAEEPAGETASGISGGVGTGDEIPAPEPDIDAYEEIVLRNKPEIERLLRKLKQIMSPNIARSDFQTRGRLMKGILAKAYAGSMSRSVSKIYHHTTLSYEKQRVAIYVLVDFSGSMNQTTAEDVVTIMNEVFGRWIEDKAYGIAVFGENRQKIKTFFEGYYNTRHRIGGISVNRWGTMLETSLNDALLMFNGINEDREKVLIVASDLCLGDEDESVKKMRELLRADVKIIFVKLCSSRPLPEIEAEKNVESVTVRNVQDLPSIFADVYIKTARG